MNRKEQLLEELAKIDLMIEMESAKTNYKDYVKYTHRYDKKFKMAKFQEYICDCVDKLLNDELINPDGKPYEGICLSQPPQTGKSLCITETAPSYYLGRFPYNHAIEISYGEDLAVRFGRRNKQKVEEFGKALFGIELSKHSSSALEFELSKTNGGMISRGIGGQITGSPADFILIDDPYKNRQEADSPSFKKFVNDEWLNTIQTRASAKCKYIVVHTRWNEDDLIGTLLAQEPEKWFEISFPAIAEKDELETSGRKLGEALLPEAGKDLAWLINKRKSYEKDPTEGGIRAWNALYQQRPSSLEGNMIKREYWQRFDLTLEMQKQGFFPVKIQSWDLALKDTADPVAGQIWGKLGSNYYLLDHKGGRMDIKKSMQGIIDWDKKHPDATAKLIEDKANGPAAIRMLRNKIHGLIPVNPGTKSKAERVNVILPLFMAGNVFVPKKIEVSPGIFKHCEWAEEIIEQCAAFKPDKKVQRDDEVDACFVAGTPIATLFGDKPIEKIKIGDRVITPFGIRKVVNAWCTGEREVIQYKNLTGTPNHKVFTYENGFIPMDTLTQALNNDIMSLGGVITWRYKRLLHLMGKPTTLWEGQESIISVTKTVVLKNEKVLKDFMWRFGNFITKFQFLQGMKFITKMAILLIMTLTTWSVYLLGNTRNYINSKTRKSKTSISKESDHSQKNGTNQKKAESGTKNIGLIQLGKSNLKNTSANNAGKTLKAKENQDSVLTTAMLNGDTPTNLKLLKKIALYVEKNLNIKNVQGKIRKQTKYKLVAGRVNQNWHGETTSKVYNITVEKDHVYYAHGLLVANCSQGLNWLMWREAKPQVADRIDMLNLYGRNEKESFDFGEVTQDFIDYGVNI